MNTKDGSPCAKEADVDPVQQAGPRAPAAPEQKAPQKIDSKVKEQRMIEAQTGERDMDRAVKILAKSIFRQLTMNGYETRQIVALSTELIGLVTSSMNGKTEPAEPKG